MATVVLLAGTTVNRERVPHRVPLARFARASGVRGLL